MKTIGMKVIYREVIKGKVKNCKGRIIATDGDMVKIRWKDRIYEDGWCYLRDIMIDEEEAVCVYRLKK